MLHQLTERQIDFKPFFNNLMGFIYSYHRAAIDIDKTF